MRGLLVAVFFGLLSGTAAPSTAIPLDNVALYGTGEGTGTLCGEPGTPDTVTVQGVAVDRTWNLLVQITSTACPWVDPETALLGAWDPSGGCFSHGLNWWICVDNPRPVDDHRVLYDVGRLRFADYFQGEVLVTFEPCRSTGCPWG